MVKILVQNVGGIVTVTLESAEPANYFQFVVPEKLFAPLMQLLLDEGYLT
jgi:hypothetical protein